MKKTSRFTKKFVGPFVLTLAIATPTVSTHAFAAEVNTDYSTFDNTSAPNTAMTPFYTNSTVTYNSEGTGEIINVYNSYPDGTSSSSSYFQPFTDEADGEVIEPIDPEDVIYFDNYNLGNAQQELRYNEINAVYGVGETLAPEDAEFIQAYGQNFDDLNAADIQEQSLDYSILNDTSASFSEGKTFHGVTVSFKGKLYTSNGWTNQSYRGDVTSKITAGGSKVNRIKNVITHVGYGATGLKSVGKIYSGSTSNTTTSSTTLYTDKTVKYTAVEVYGYTNAYTEVTTDDGEFNLYAF
ncbi:hypothetical protein HPK19_19340 [Arthrobacter citreus]|nr:hypothetical protein HPK19_19340 [Arthrobacter citreus]